jgi:signal transduction histidine kinase
VSQILTDDRGRVWFAGNQGIFQIRERDFDDVAKGSIKRLSPIIYGRNEGMSGLQASFDFSPNAWRASDGRRMYFSMLSGLAEVMLDYSYPNQLPPAACIERVSADGQTVVEYQGGGVATNEAHAAQLELGTPGNKDSLRFPPGTHRVQFEFTAPNFVAPESVQFRYRLEGSGEKWVDAGSNRVASYSRPPPGCYRFRVIARNENGVWDEKGKDVPVIFEPYIWETHWFRLTAAAGILGVLFGVVTALLRLKHGRAIKKMQDLQYLELERARIARMMTLGQLGASIAHEVNQPLSAMIMDAYACLGWLEQDFPNLPEVRDALHRIMRDGKRGGDIVARIRAVLKNEPPFKEQVNINELIREIIIIVEPNLQGVAVELRLDKNLPSVFADRVQLQQVLLNLAVNAIHAMEQITNRPRVLHIRTTSQENHGVLVEIEDSGIGLSAEGISQVFKPFFTTKAGGMGLGLAISRSIVETHHGRLWATANQSSGATFHFTIDDFTQSYLPKIK